MLPKPIKCTGTGGNDSPTTSSPSDSGTVFGIGSAVAVAVCVILVLLGLFTFLYWRYRKHSTQPTANMQHFEEINTALDEDLLEAKEAKSLNDDGKNTNSEKQQLKFNSGFRSERKSE